jgi:hypothetical protein
MIICLIMKLGVHFRLFKVYCTIRFHFLFACIHIMCICMYEKTHPISYGS